MDICIRPQWFLGDALLMTTGLGSDYVYSRILLGIISLPFKPGMIASILGLWDVLPPVPRQCQQWTSSHGWILKLNQPLDDHSFKVCATTAVVYLAGRTNYRLKHLWPGGYPSGTARSIAWL